MPLLTTPTTEPAQEIPEPVVTVTPDTSPDLPYRPTYKDNAMRSTETDLNALLQHIDGSPWTVDFYLGLQGSGQANVGFTLDAQEGALFQQYHRIRDLELKVTSPLTMEHDGETGNTYFEGEANFYARVVPNLGHVFLADIGNGRRVLFEITNATPTSALKNTVYRLTYRSKMEYNEEVRSALDAATIKTSVFVRESLFGLSRGLFTTDEHNVYLEAKASLERLHELYGREFYDEKNDTVMLAPDTVYDPHLVDFVNKLPKDNLNAAQRYREIVIKHDGLNEGSLFSALMGEAYPPTKMVKQYKHQLVIGSHLPIIYGGIVATDIMEYVTRATDVIPKPEPSALVETLPLFHSLPLVYYVMSADAYEYDTPTSILEREVLKFQEGKVVDLLAVAEMASTDELYKLTPAQRFYYMPLIMFLLCVVIREY